MTRACSPATAAGVKTGTALCLATALAIIVVAALGVSVAGLGGATRSSLGFGFGGVANTPGEAARIALHNARVAGGTLVCAALAPRLKLRGRRVLTLVLLTVLTCSAAGVGIAIGAYGTRVIAAVAAHLPIEFGALSLAGGAYLQACRQPLTGRELALLAAATALLLVAAATVETYVSLGGTR